MIDDQRDEEIVADTNAVPALCWFNQKRTEEPEEPVHNRLDAWRELAPAVHDDRRGRCRQRLGDMSEAGKKS